MARQLRIQYLGAIYQVMNRGDRREAIFPHAHDRKCFLQTLREACEKTGWQVHAFCLPGREGAKAAVADELSVVECSAA